MNADLSEREEVEDFYPLCPMQEGMLFHTLYASETGVDIEQMVWTFHKELNIPAFEQAWQRVVERHPVLRTSFRWQDRSRPIQDVHRPFKISLEKHDWGGLGSEESKTCLKSYLEHDRRKGFDLSKAPLFRLALFCMDDQQYHLVWTFHHIILDGRSFPILLKEVFARYGAAREGRVLNFSPIVSYRTFIDYVEKQDFSRAEQFWRELLQGFSSPTPLAVDRGSPTKASPPVMGEKCEICLSRDTTFALGQVISKANLTLNTLVQGAWSILLSRYSGQADVVFGVTRACRRAFAGADSIVGLLINTVPMRVRVHPEAKLIPWLQGIREQQIAIRAHELTSLVKVTGWSQVPPGTPLFASVLVFENYDLSMFLRAQGHEWEACEFKLYEKSNYPLTLAAQASETLALQLIYERERFDRASIQRMLGHLQTLLEGIAANPERMLRELPMLTAAERQQLLREWNDNSAPSAQSSSVQQLFEAQVLRSPQALALVGDEGSWTYEKLNSRSNQLAHSLRAQGVGPETLVGVYTEGSIEMIVGLLGILKAGGAYVPLDFASPKERLAFLLEDAAIAFLLTKSPLLEDLASYRGRTLLLDKDWEKISREKASNPESVTSSQNLAYVIYTSGSTGSPKGIQIEHRSLINLITWHQRVYGVSSSDRATQVANPAFDASVWEIWPYLTAGASLFLAREKIRTSPSEWVPWLIANRITFCFLPTPIAEAALGIPWPTGTTLRFLLTGGDELHALPPQEQPFRVVNHYGPTENTVVTTFVVLCPKEQSKAPLPIGRPIDNTQVYILDRQDEPVPIGVPGELHIAGPGLARGYLKRPELTAEKFIPNPFNNETGRRLYRSGDLARYRPDGNIEFLGRTDHQVKIRGFRIELGEIEAILRQHPEIREAVVAAQDSNRGEKQLVAYLVPHHRGTASNDDLRSFLQKKLPDYMIPRIFMMLSSLPLTSNGKVDRQALRVPGQTDLAEETPFVGPRTSTESQLARIWCEVLGREKIGIHDNFFHLGGHSLLAIQIMSRLPNSFHLELPLGYLFENPTIAGLAKAIEGGQAHRGISNPVPEDRESGTI